MKIFGAVGWMLFLVVSTAWMVVSFRGTEAQLHVLDDNRAQQVEASEKLLVLEERAMTAELKVAELERTLIQERLDVQKQLQRADQSLKMALQQTQGELQQARGELVQASNKLEEVRE